MKKQVVEKNSTFPGSLTLRSSSHTVFQQAQPFHCGKAGRRKYHRFGFSEKLDSKELDSKELGVLGYLLGVLGYLLGVPI